LKVLADGVIRQQGVAASLAYPVVELVRESRMPMKARFACSRAGLGMDTFTAPGLRWMTRNPVGAVRRVVGVPDRSGPIWAVTVVRNEEQRISGSIRRLFADGIDHVIVADNLSTDGTRDVVLELARDLPISVVSDDESAFYQGTKVSLMARAAARCGAAWIVPFDADELWFGTDASIASTLHSLEGDVAVAPMFDFLPRVDQELVADPYVEFTRRTEVPVTRKVAFRAHLLASVVSGNHSVNQPARRVEGKLFIRHYPFLDFEHFVRKAVRGTRALEETDLSTKISDHWRRWASMRDTALEAEWRSICATGAVEDPLPDGVFEQHRGFST
jgi:hypothetical protein